MRLKILAVDDEPETLQFFKDVVESLGCDVTALTNSRDAAERVQKEKFDLIALDVVMPSLDGFQLTERIRSSKSNRLVPILMFTGKDSLETMKRGYEAGITFYLAKPLDVQKLRGFFKAARGMAIQERRRYIRLPFRTDVVCRGGGRHLKIQSVDLSQGGILLGASAGLAEGDIVDVSFTLPGSSQPLKVMGKVVRRLGPEGMAIEFIELEGAERALLQDFIAGRTKE
jgi:CheY-like chemotaxis protein